MKAYAPKTQGGSPSKSERSNGSTELMPQGNPVMGWLSSSANWLADRYKDTTSTIDGWVDGVSQSAQELWDVANSSSISINENSIELNSDLDEILDLLPGDIQQQLQLDRERSSNAANLSFDRNSGEITVRAPSIAIQGANIDTFSMGAGTLEGVEITIRNASGSLPVIGAFSFGEGESPSTRISIQRALANTVEIQSENGPIGADHVELNDILIDLSSDQKGLFGASDGQRNFSVGSSNIQGLKTSEFSAAELAITEASAQLNADGASINAQNISAQNLSHDNGQADSAALLGVSAQFQSQNDKTTAQVHAKQSSVQGLKSNDLGSLGTAQINDLSFSNASGIQTTAQQINLSEIDTANLDASSANLSQVSFRKSDEGLGLSVGEGKIVAIDTDQVDAASASIADLSLRHSDIGTHVSLGQAQGTGIDGANVGTIDSAAVSQASFSNTNGLYSSAEQLTLSGIDTEHVDATALSLDQLTFQQNQNGLSATAAQANVEQVDTKHADIASGKLTDLKLTHSEGVTNSQLGQGTVYGIESYGNTLGSAHVTGLSSTHSPQNDLVKLDSISATSLQNDNGNVDHAMALGLSYHHKNGNHSARFDTAELSGTHVNGVGTMDSLKASQLSGHFGQYTQSVEFDEITAQGLQDEKTTATLGQISVDQGKIRNGVDGLHGQLQAFSLQNGQLHNNSIGSLSASDIQAHITDKGAGASVQSATLEAAQLGDNALRVDSGHIEQAGISTTDTNWQEALKNNHFADGTQGHLQRAQFQGISSESELGKANVSSAIVNGAEFSADSSSYSVSADQAKLNAARLQTAQLPQRNGNPNFDNRAIIGSIASRIDSGHVNAQMNMNSGKIADSPLKVLNDTTLSANLGIENNRLASGSEVNFSKPIDAPLWFTVKGASIDDKGRAMADVGGWGNKNITKDLNKAAGVSGPQVADLGTLVGGIMSAQSEPKTASDPVVDTQSIQANGHLHFSDGRLSGNNIGATLTGADQGANQLNFATEAQKITASFANFLASSLSLSGPTSELTAGSAQALDADLVLDPKRGTATGAVSEINVRNINASGQIK